MHKIVNHVWQDIIMMEVNVFNVIIHVQYVLKVHVQIVMMDIS